MIIRLAINSFLFSCFLFVAAVAADFYQLGAIGSGTEALVIDEHGVCNRVANSTANVFFIPTKTAGEWAAFRSSPPTGVVVEICCAKIC